MTYQETLNYLFASQPAFHLVGAAAYKPGFDNIYRLLENVGNPHKKLKCIHVAGTNGKGSTSHLIAATLQEAGYKTGLFTSPHLVDFRERIRINGKCIDQQSVINFVEQNKSVLEDVKPSFFETTFALAADYFEKQNVDVCVIEVGLGGRLDSTNVITPDLCVITNIGLDHTDFLGNTMQSVAAEKAGIIKQGVPVVIGESSTETYPIFAEKAQQLNAPILFADSHTYDLTTWECELTGTYQLKNKNTAYCALKRLCECGYNITEYNIRNGFKQVCTLTGLRGRWEMLQETPLVICDTGHNAHGLQYVGQQLKAYKPGKVHVVFGMVKDKDIDTALAMLPTNATYYFTQAGTSRALPATELQQMAAKHQLKGNTYTNVEQAINVAYTQMCSDDMLLIGGSNYLVGEALSLPRFQHNIKEK